MRLSAYLIVALGSGLGGALRHAVNVGSTRLLGAGGPYGTFTVNVAGSFAVGAIAAYFALRGHGGHAWLLFLATGVLGGFTTFSAFSLEIVLLYERGHVSLAALYLVGSVALSIVALLLGLTLGRRLL
jgi:CrcB protein